MTFETKGDGDNLIVGVDALNPDLHFSANGIERLQMKNTAHRDQIDRDYHDKIASVYDEVVVAPRQFANDLLFSPVHQLLPDARDRMLDFGCGTGHMSLRFGKYFRQKHLVDHSEGMLASAKSNLTEAKIEQTTLIQSELEQFLKTNTIQFNFICCVGVLHHFDLEAQSRVLTQFRRALAEDGRLLIAEPILTNTPEPKLLSKWNQKARTKQHYNVDSLVEPDEGPIDLSLMLNCATSGGLDLRWENRSWEILPKFESATLNRFATKILFRLVNRTDAFVWSGLFAAKSSLAEKSEAHSAR